LSVRSPRWDSIRRRLDSWVNSNDNWSSTWQRLHKRCARHNSRKNTVGELWGACVSLVMVHPWLPTTRSTSAKREQQIKQIGRQRTLEAEIHLTRAGMAWTPRKERRVLRLRDQGIIHGPRVRQDVRPGPKTGNNLQKRAIKIIWRAVLKALLRVWRWAALLASTANVEFLIAQRE